MRGFGPWGVVVFLLAFAFVQPIGGSRPHVRPRRRARLARAARLRPLGARGARLVAGERGVRPVGRLRLGAGENPRPLSQVRAVADRPGPAGGDRLSVADLHPPPRPAADRGDAGTAAPIDRGDGDRLCADDCDRRLVRGRAAALAAGPARPRLTSAESAAAARRAGPSSDRRGASGAASPTAPRSGDPRRTSAPPAAAPAARRSADRSASDRTPAGAAPTRDHRSSAAGGTPRASFAEHPDWLADLALLSIRYQLLKDIYIQGRSGWDGSYSDTECKRNNDTYTNAYYGAYSKTNESTYEWNNDVLVNYNKKFSDFVMDLNAGANHRLYEYENISGSGSTFNVENMFALANTADPRPGESYSKKVVNSVFGFAELSWRNAIFLNLTGRNDWSSTLPTFGRSYFYPSVGLAAVLSDLMTLPENITHLKFRGSYAVVGNDTSPYQLVRTATFGTGGVITLSNKLPNANLKPESTRSIEIGLDLRMYKDRIRLGFTWYQTNTYDQLFATPVPVTSGVVSIYQNGADVQNRGAEITLGAAFIQGKDFSWDIDFNWAKNKSKVVKIAEGFNELSLGRDYIGEYKLIVGDAFGDFYATGFQRKANGNVIMYSNGIPKINWSVKCANYNPDWVGGISNNFTWKNFNFSSLIDIRWGGTFISWTEVVCVQEVVSLITPQLEGTELCFSVEMSLKMKPALPRQEMLIQLHVPLNYSGIA